MNEDALREDIEAKLASGLKTEAFPRPENSEESEAIVTRLQTEAGEDLTQKLVIAGFTDHAVEVDGVEQHCETCMYFLINAKFCELPELMLPVEPQWACRLWRI